MISGSKPLQVCVLGIAVALAMVISGCRARTVVVRPDTPGAAQATSDLERFTSHMCGQFSSAAQASADPEFRDIRLRVVRVWEGRENPQFVWLYVEQAMASDLEHPYRQRIYRVSSPQRGMIQSDVYSLAVPAAVVGAWRDQSLLDSVAVRDLSVRLGCSVFLTCEADRFVGGTRERDCSSELSGAKYATSEANIGRDGMVTWDRGFDASGKQVWGATKGGYRFDKIPEDIGSEGK